MAGRVGDGPRSGGRASDSQTSSKNLATGHESVAPMTEDGGNRYFDLPESELAWFERRRVAIPEPPPDYFDRPALIESLMPTEHRIALLQAPGGFGKTALLAHCCRLLDKRDVATAWLCADTQDTRLTFETYLAFALRRAGVEIENPLRSSAWAAADDRIGLLLRAVEAHPKPCVVAFDELERLADRGAVQALSSLVRGAPPNLHLAFACRELPLALDIAEVVLTGQEAILSTDELRFSKPEIAAFFDLRLSRERLASLHMDSAGWPIALRVYRNAWQSDTPGQARAFHDLLGNWFETRLWRDLATDDRDFLLDIGLFDHIDADLLDEVLEGGDARQRLQAIPDHTGLIDARTDAGMARLHPLVRGHCAKRRFRETPVRFRRIHMRAARALERRGETVAAMRHAAEVGDAGLVGRILENAGGLRLWLRHGPPRMEDVEPFLTDNVIEASPRLTLARCLLYLFSDRLADAGRVFDRAAAQSDGFTRNASGDDRDVRIDHCIIQGVMCLYGCTPVGAAHTQKAAADLVALAQDDTLDPATRGALEFSLCVYDNLRAEFETALERAKRARQFISDGLSPYMTMQLDLQVGSMTMAQGRVGDAEASYLRSLKRAKAVAAPTLYGDVLLRELELERNRLAHAVGLGLRTRDSFAQPGHTFESYAAESAIVTELTEHAVGTNVALDGLAEMSEYARRTDRPTLVQYLAALRVSVLAAAGRVTEAEQTWRADGLPVEDDGCLSLEVRHWREMEALACARLRLLTAQGAFGHARRFGVALLATAEANRLRRTAMRGLAMSMAVEYRAGDLDAASERLTAFLRLFADTDYARPLVREGDAGTPVLGHLLDRSPDAEVKAAARDLLALIGNTTEKQAVAKFSDRELEVLERLANRRDKQIAAELGITADGVRYHVRRIFAKLGARDRHDATHRARTIGLLVDLEGQG